MEATFPGDQPFSGLCKRTERVAAPPFPVLDFIHSPSRLSLLASCMVIINSQYLYLNK